MDYVAKRMLAAGVLLWLLDYGLFLLEIPSFKESDSE